MTPLTPTEIEELRMCIAAEMGYEKRGKWWSKPGHKGGQSIGDFVASLPPYTTSIDSIREAAMERFKLFADSMEFNAQLGIRASELANTIGLSQWKWQLTALDWCIAFARTAKIWRFKV